MNVSIEWSDGLRGRGGVGLAMSGVPMAVDEFDAPISSVLSGRCIPRNRPSQRCCRDGATMFDRDGYVSSCTVTAISNARRQVDLGALKPD